MHRSRQSVGRGALGERDAYIHATQYLGERVRMMQAWADYLDGLRAGKVAVPIRRAG